MHHLSYSVTGTCLTSLSINPSHECLHLSVIMFLYSNIWFKLIFNIVFCSLLRWVPASSCTSIHRINIIHVMPASTITITMADFGLLWGLFLRERLPLDIFSHWDKKTMVVWWTSLLKMFTCLTEKIGCPGPVLLTHRKLSNFNSVNHVSYLVCWNLIPLKNVDLKKLNLLLIKQLKHLQLYFSKTVEFT